MQNVPSMIFVFCVGAAVGSFVNVLNYRLPAGMSVVSPPSRCPTCGARLRFFRENLPIIGWFAVRGKCRYCKAKISPEYMFVELLMALVFLGLYAMLFAVSWRTAWWGEIGGPWWVRNTFFHAWPAYFALAFLVASLISMTMIDARTFTIPIQIPVFVTVVAFVLYPLQAVLAVSPAPTRQSWMLPCLDWGWTAIIWGGMVGVVIAMMLLRTGVIRFSFADYDEYIKGDEVIAQYPHARREMGLEVLFLTPCIVGMLVGYFVGGMLPADAPPHWVQALTGSLAGYLIGAGIVWAVRILGTLGFGREAMGLGDVHLLGAVGAVIGWFEPILVFFVVAPFSGLVWAAMSMGLGAVFQRLRRHMPYGPHLALATIVVILCRPGINRLWNATMPIPIPQRQLVVDPPPP
jgi:leader peptidase (prepilin peptidase)/N-methyltransferase